MGNTIALTRSENVSKFSDDPLLARGNTLRSGEDRLKLQELMELCYKFETESQEVREERKVQNSQAQKIIQGWYVLDGDEVLAEPEVTVKDVNLSVDKVTLAQVLAALKSAKVQEKANVVEEPSESITTTPTLTTTTVAATITVVSTRPKAKGLFIHEEEQATTPAVSSQQPSELKVQGKGKGKMEEPEKPIKKNDLIRL
ncbi:hypothetical protein Tco_0102391, partial [Tanacetum coccineum]